MSDTNRVSLGIVREVTPGTTPGNPNIQALRITGTPNLAFNPITVTSDEIRADRNVTDLALVGAEAGGDAGMELSYGALDMILEGALFNTWVQQNYRLGSDITDIDNNVITVLTGDAFEEDDLIFLDGFGDENDGIVFVAEETTNATTITAPGGLTDNDSPPASAAVRKVGVQTEAGDIETAVTPNRLTSTNTDFTELGLLPGDWIKLGGPVAATRFPTAANNGWCRVQAVEENTVFLDVVPAGWAADVTTTETIWIWMGDRLRNGTVKLSHTLEQVFNDHDPLTYQYYTGMHVNTLNLTIGTQAIVTSSVGFMGFNVSVANSRVAGANTIPAPQHDVLNSSSNVGRIGRGTFGTVGAPNYVLDGTVAINNNLRRQNAVMHLGSVGIGTGEFNVSGTLNCYFGNKDLLEDVLNNTERSLDLRFHGPGGHVVLIDMPRLKYSAGFPGVPGKNQDVLINLGYQSLLERNTDLFTMQIQRFHKVQ